MLDMTEPTGTTVSGASLSFDDDSSRWAALCERDPRADGVFYYSVKTTGVFCRPSCTSRRALRANVNFHETCADAESAGFRACKRCKPTQVLPLAATSALVEKACRLIEASESLPSLNELAEACDVSPYHFHRLFKGATGVTPRAYAVAHRARRVRAGLTESNGVEATAEKRSMPLPTASRATSGNLKAITATYFDAGFNSSARFYSDSSSLLGMTPSRYREGGKDAVIRFAVGHCSLGEILVAATDVGICAILLGDDADTLVHDLQDRFPKAELIGGDEGFESLVAQVVGLVDQPGTSFHLPLDVRGTAFQQRVWQALREIPAGTTASYTDIAVRLGSPKSVRAVAGACAANAIAVAIPCHRVVRSDGGLSGYRWGVDRKRALLLKESGR